MNDIDEKPRARSAPLPATPHDLHAYGPMTPGNAGRVMGASVRTVYERISDGELPTVPVLGEQRVEPLVAWAARQGAGKETLHAIPRALRKGASVDDVIALVDAAIEADQAKPREKRARRGKKSAIAPKDGAA